MADQRITELTELSQVGVAATDVLPIADVSASETKKITVSALVGAGFNLATSVIDLNKLDQNSTTKLGTVAIADDAITYAKIQDVSAGNKLLGRVTGSGPVEEIACTAAGRSLIAGADAAAQRTTLGLGSTASITFGTVTAAVVASSASITTATISGGTITGITDLTVADGGTGASTASDARQNLGVRIGADVQAYDAGLQSISDLLTAADQSIYLTAADTYATYTLTQAGRNLLDDADAAAQRITLGLGTLATLNEVTELADNTVQTADVSDNQITYAKIQDVTATDRLLGRSTAATVGNPTGAGDIEEITCTAAGRALLDDADAAAQRTTLGLGTLATLNTVTGSQITDLSVNTADLAENSVTIAKLNLNAQELSGTLITNSTIDTAQLATDAVSTAKVEDNAITYGKIQNVSTQNIILGRIGPGAGDVQEISCTAAGRALIDDTTVADQRTTLGLGTLATLNTISGTNIVSGGIGTAQIASDAVTYDKIQNTVGTDVVLGRSIAGAGSIQEIACTAAGRALIGDATAAEQRDTLGLGNLATATGTWTNGSSFSGTSSGTNTGDQTITLTGAVTGSGTGSFATTLASDIVAAANIQTDAVTTAKINDSAVNASKLGDQSTCIVTNATPFGSGDFIGQGWFNTGTSIAYRWDGTNWTQESGIQSITVTDSTPLSVVVNNPNDFTANITLALDTQAANTVFVGPTAGDDAAPSFRALIPDDLPDATTSTKGIVQPGTGLSVSSGTLNHTNVVAGATKSGITFDNQGHITSAVDLIASDIPDLDASKITTGSFDSNLIGAGAVTAAKLANKSTASIGETLPVAAFTGQLHFNPLDKNFFLWDGNVWQSIGISAGAIILAGTYDASTNLIASVTGEGSAIGLTVGNALPSPSNNNSNYYLVVSEPGTGTSPAPTVALAPPDLLLSTGTEWLEIDVSSTYTAQTANNVAFSPAASLGSTNVQSALEEVSNECRNVDNMTGGVLDVARGGTNIASYAKGDLIAASASTTLDKLTVGANGYILSANSSEATGLEWIENQVGTVTQVSVSAPLNVTNASTTPTLTIDNGTTTAVGVVQLTDGVASSSVTTAATPNSVKTAYDLAADAMPKTGGTFVGEVHIGYNGSLVFEGPTDDALETTLTLADPTADQVITLPDATGTVALTSQLDDGTF